jgi:hypothetical protein
MSKEQYIEHIRKSDSNIQELFTLMGGNIEAGKIPIKLEEFREDYSVIIFIDEYLRQTSVRIRNILRGILNNQLGRHQIPKTTFFVYATNLKEHEIEGIDEVPLNTQFGEIKLVPPTEDEWFSWLVNKFKNDEHGVVLNQHLINRFHKLLKENNYFSSMEENVRTSPRRWEQILLYINASLPVKDAKDAKNLLSNIKVNFKDYMTGEHSRIVDDVLDATAKLIKQTSGITVDATDVNDSATEWMDTLEHQIQTRMKPGMNKHRTYVPVISGQPGVAKTAEAARIANTNNLRYVHIDVSTLLPEDAQGMPLAQRQENNKIKTVFSAPALYQRIMEDIHRLDKEYIEGLKKEFPSNFQEKIDKYNKQPLKYLVFFDELNRNSPKVFNGIRRVLLEKNFGPGRDRGSLLKLPTEAMLMAAINPHDSGAQELTKHAQDVLDIIDVKPSWSNTEHFMKVCKLEYRGRKISDEIREIAINIMKGFADKFGTKDPEVAKNLRPFQLNFQNIYMSPREYAMAFQSITTALYGDIRDIEAMDPPPQQSQFHEIEQELRDHIFTKIEVATRFILTKHDQSQAEEFWLQVKSWIDDESSIDFGKTLFFTKGVDTKTMDLETIIGPHLEKTATRTLHENSAYLAYISNVNQPEFAEQLRILLSDRLVADGGKKADFYLNPIHPKIKLAKKGKLLNAEQVVARVHPDGYIADPTEKASLFENCLREMLIIISGHVSNQFLEAISQTFSQLIPSFRRGTIEGLDKEVALSIAGKLAKEKTSLGGIIATLAVINATGEYANTLKSVKDANDILNDEFQVNDQNKDLVLNEIKMDLYLCKNEIQGFHYDVGQK